MGVAVGGWLYYRSLNESLARGLARWDRLADAATSAPYWIGAPPADVRHRSWIRYVVPPRLSLWYDPAIPGPLGGLSVARARGGGTYIIQPHQWTAIVAAAGGWPVAEQ